MITEKEGYETMIHALYLYWKRYGRQKNISDIVRAAAYLPNSSTPVDSTLWQFWLEAKKQLKKEGPIYLTLTKD